MISLWTWLFFTIFIICCFENLRWCVDLSNTICRRRLPKSCFPVTILMLQIVYLLSSLRFLISSNKFSTQIQKYVFEEDLISSVDSFTTKIYSVLEDFHCFKVLNYHQYFKSQNRQVCISCKKLCHPRIYLKLICLSSNILYSFLFLVDEYESFTLIYLVVVLGSSRFLFLISYFLWLISNNLLSSRWIY